MSGLRRGVDSSWGMLPMSSGVAGVPVVSVCYEPTRSRRLAMGVARCAGRL